MFRDESDTNKPTTDFVVISSDDVQEALRLWHGGEATGWPFIHLRLGLQVGFEQEQFGSLADNSQATQNRAILNLGLEQLHTVNPESEELIRQRFEHRQDVMMVANSRNLSRSSLFYRQRLAISQLTEILNQLEKEASHEWRERMVTRLELPTYTELVGISEPHRILFEALLDEQQYFIIAIDGLGGLGKSALADHLARNFIQLVRFDEIVWITAKQTHLSTRGRLQIDSSRPALTFPMLLEELATEFNLPTGFHGSQLQKQRLVKRFLEQRACLIVIDNLETVADYKALLPELKQWQNPSKFLLTSRLRLLDQPDVFSYSLSQLDESAAFQLIRQEAKKAGFSDLATASDKDLKQIHEVVGGNPLALKLVVGQLRFHSLARVLARLGKGQQDEGLGLFDYIYQEAWDSLDDNSRTTLLSLVQSGETGFTLDHILEITNLSASTVEQSLEELILLSLVDLKGSLLDRRYTLHRLTEVFLLKILE